VCRIAEKAPGLFKAPVARVSFPDLPTPASPALEEAYYPGAQDIVRAVQQTLSI
jgi:Pyruvate/2-oxoglutarate dehydrogenase complex, dehydrogenase (E1) component, eukaryotic type, beta subunit